MHLTHSLSALSLLASARAITTYGQIPFGQATATANAATYTGAAAYNLTTLQPPPLPNPPPANTFFLQLAPSADTQVNLSIPHAGTFLGWSIEMSVINQVLGRNSSFLQVPFLNLLSNIKQRAGSVHVRVGGNTQETATLVPELPDGKLIEKDLSHTLGRTDTPPLDYTPEVFYMMGNISSLVNAKWYLGLPFNNSANVSYAVMEWGERVLGDHMLGFQIGNEPDLYAGHQRRLPGYSPWDYFGEFGQVVQAVGNNPNIPVKNNMIGPSVASGFNNWTPEQIWDTGFIPAYSSSLGWLAVEHYPRDNCAFTFPQPNAPIINPQDVFGLYLTHKEGQQLVAPYLNSTAIAQAAGKPMMMFETNTASCGGFGGISNAFASALWGLDYGFQLAYGNFSEALIHVGGQNVYYNPFTAPPTNQTSFHQWSVGPIYYSSLIIAEAFGQSNTSRIVDLFANYGNEFQPAYGIYENGKPTKIAMFNYMDDHSGANDYTATFAIGGGQTGQPGATPSQIKVKYLLAPSVSSLDNITWAGQTLGGIFASDGRFTGSLDIKTVDCDTTAGTCAVKVPAPGFALVFLDSSDPSLQGGSVDAPKTFATTAATRTHNTATIASSVLATMNGMNANTRGRGSTSKGSTSTALAKALVPGMTVLLSTVLGVFFVGRAVAY